MHRTAEAIHTGIGPDTGRLYDQAAQLVKIGAFECDLADERLSWTDGVYDIFDLPRRSAVTRAETVELYEDESRAQMERMRSEAIGGGGSFSLDCRIRTRRGLQRWMRLTAHVAVENGRAVRIFGAKQDITAERSIRDRLRERADHDPLTGLANRGTFETRFGMLAARTNLQTRLAGLVLVNIEGVTATNDRFGQDAGDACLREAGSRLARAFHDPLLVARVAGHRFAVLLPGPLMRLTLTEALARALQALCRPVIWTSKRLDIGATFGVAILKRHSHRGPETLFAQAEFALAAAQGPGANGVCIFGDDFRDRLAVL